MKHHAQPAEIRFCSEDVVPVDERTRHWEERSTTPNRPKPHFVPKAWCPATKEQGIAGSEAPRSTGRIRFCSEGVVPGDERTRHCGERSTTPNRPKPHFVPKTWCPSTEEQGVAGSEAPRPTGRNQILLQRRGARRRKIKALGGAKHHAQPAEAPFYPKDVVSGDERTRHCGERSTTPNRPKPHFVPKTWCPATKRTRHWGERSTTSNPPKPHFAPKTWCSPTKNKILQTTLSRY